MIISSIMGYRTVVVLNNDHNWQADPGLGKKIQNAADNFYQTGKECWFDGGNVVQVCHADVKSVMIVDSLCAKQITTVHYTTTDIDAIRAAAEKLGYRLSKIPA